MYKEERNGEMGKALSRARVYLLGVGMGSNDKGVFMGFLGDKGRQRRCFGAGSQLRSDKSKNYETGRRYMCNMQEVLGNTLGPRSVRREIKMENILWLILSSFMPNFQQTQIITVIVCFFVYLFSSALHFFYFTPSLAGRIQSEPSPR